MKPIITIDEFNKLEMRVGKVVEATHPTKSEKLIRLVVDFGLKDKGDKGNPSTSLPSKRLGTGRTSMGDEGEEHEIRIIFTGVRGFGYTKEDFLGKQFFFVTNLAPRKTMGEESQGMILAVDPTSLKLRGASGQEKPLFLSAEGMPVGALIR